MCDDTPSTIKKDSESSTDKLSLLLEIDRLRDLGVEFNKYHDMDSSIDELRFECLLQKQRHDDKQRKSFNDEMKSLLLNTFTMIPPYQYNASTNSSEILLSKPYEKIKLPASNLDFRLDNTKNNLFPLETSISGEMISAALDKLCVNIKDKSTVILIGILINILMVMISKLYDKNIIPDDENIILDIEI